MNKFIINTKTRRYPMQPHQVVQELGGGVTLPDQYTIPDGYAWVTPTPKPTFNKATHRLVESDPVETNGVWYQRWSTLPLTQDEMKNALEVAKINLAKQVTDMRWAKESAGILLPDGTRIATKPEDQNRITSVIANAELAGIETISFKAASGWTTLTISQVKGIACMIALHVQACFNTERAHHEAIVDLTNIEQVNSYNITEGWDAASTTATKQLIQSMFTPPESVA